MSTVVIKTVDGLITHRRSCQWDLNSNSIVQHQSIYSPESVTRKSSHAENFNLIHFDRFQLLTGKLKIFIWNSQNWDAEHLLAFAEHAIRDGMSFSVQRSAVISLSGVVCQCWTSSEPAQIVGEKRLWHLWRVSICITSVVGPVPLIHKTSRKDKASSLCASVRSRSSCERVKREKLPCRWAESGRILHWRW